ncbi:MAG TPA: outer membrane lipoprotein carrier protein LolA [Segetibacter sp.]|jgi:outer membrane lipoprotein-sorting protein
MTKLYHLFLILLVFTVQANAQNDANAKKVLDEVSSRLKTYKGVAANFSLLSKSRTGKVNNNVAGKILIKGNKYYIKQGATEIFSDGIKTWNYNGEGEVTVTAADADEQTLTPQRLLTNFYDKDFSYKLVSSTGATNEIQMIPTDKRKNFKQVNVFVDKAKMMITKARVVDKSSNTIQFSLSNINTNTTIADKTFVFNPKNYKQAIEVIE